MDKVFSFVCYNKEEKVFVIINFFSEVVLVLFELLLFEVNYIYWSSKEFCVFFFDIICKFFLW